MGRTLIFTVNPGATSTKCALYEVTDTGLRCCNSRGLNTPTLCWRSFQVSLRN
ncbi:MAG: hypothetical protein ACJAWL_001638 [Motiliproteus sp.]|jgi:hypothetical protein